MQANFWRQLVKRIHPDGSFVAFVCGNKKIQLLGWIQKIDGMMLDQELGFGSLSDLDKEVQ